MKFVITLTIGLLLVSACGRKSDYKTIDSNYLSTNKNSNSKYIVYEDYTPYAYELKSCPFVHSGSECTLTQLPLLGQENEILDIDLVLSRLLVEKKWMGDNFRDFLLTVPVDDFVNLLKVVSAIVINSETQETWYDFRTGTLFIPAHQMWLRPNEKKIVGQKSSKANKRQVGLQFYVVEHKVFNKKSIYPDIKKTSRSIKELMLPLAEGMYYALAKAVNRLQLDEVIEIDGRNTLSDILLGRELVSESKDFEKQESTLMRDVALVKYKQVRPHWHLERLLGKKVAVILSDSEISSIKSYLGHEEDLAALFTDFMMLHRFNVNSYVAITDRTKLNRVIWGRKNRIQKWGTRGRMKPVFKKLMPHLKYSSLITKRPSREDLRKGMPITHAIAVAEDKSLVDYIRDNVLVDVPNRVGGVIRGIFSGLRFW